MKFQSAPYQASDNSWTGDAVLVRLPNSASEQLPSRGMSMAEGMVNGVTFQAPLEPDGEGSHWFRVKPDLLQEAGLSIGEAASFEMEPMKVWPEPKLPDDLVEVLARDSEANAIWQSLTAAARWDWVRWITYVRKPETRAKHVQSIPSRLRAGKRRPCCFDRSVCTLTDA